MEASHVGGFDDFGEISSNCILVFGEISSNSPFSSLPAFLDVRCMIAWVIGGSFPGLLCAWFVCC